MMTGGDGYPNVRTSAAHAGPARPGRRRLPGDPAEQPGEADDPAPGPLHRIRLRARATIARPTRPRSFRLGTREPAASSGGLPPQGCCGEERAADHAGHEPRARAPTLLGVCNRRVAQEAADGEGLAVGVPGHPPAEDAMDLVRLVSHNLRRLRAASSGCGGRARRNWPFRLRSCASAAPPSDRPNSEPSPSPDRARGSGTWPASAGSRRRRPTRTAGTAPRRSRARRSSCRCSSRAASGRPRRSQRRSPRARSARARRSSRRSPVRPRSARARGPQMRTRARRHRRRTGASSSAASDGLGGRRLDARVDVHAVRLTDDRESGLGLQQNVTIDTWRAGVRVPTGPGSPAGGRTPADVHNQGTKGELRMKISRRVLLAVAAAGLAAVAAATAAHSGGSGFKTTQPTMLTPVAAGSTVTPLITVGDTLANGYRYESIPDGISFRTKNKNKLDLYVNHETSLVPFPYTPVGADRGELTERLRQLAAQPPRGRPRHGRDPLGRVRDRERRELPAVLLELPRRRGERLRQAAPLHERGGDRLGQASGLRVPGHDRCGRLTPDRRRRRPRPEERQVDADLGHGPSQPREQPRRAGLRPSRRPLGRRRVCERPGAVAGLQLHRRRLEGRLARRGRPLGVRLRHARDQRLRRHRPRLEPAAHGSLRQGPEEHRHRTQPGRHRPDGRRRRLSAAAEHRLADLERRRDRRAAVGARALERPQRRLPVHADRGHGL